MTKQRLNTLKSDKRHEYKQSKSLMNSKQNELKEIYTETYYNQTFNKEKKGILKAAKRNNFSHTSDNSS